MIGNAGSRIASFGCLVSQASFGAAMVRPNWVACWGIGCSLQGGEAVLLRPREPMIPPGGGPVNQQAWNLYCDNDHHKIAYFLSHTRGPMATPETDSAG